MEEERISERRPGLEENFIPAEMTQITTSPDHPAPATMSEVSAHARTRICRSITYFEPVVGPYSGAPEVCRLSLGYASPVAFLVLSWAGVYLDLDAGWLGW